MNVKFTAYILCKPQKIYKNCVRRRKMKKKKGKNITVKPDAIVEARYSLTSHQNDLLDIFLADVQIVMMKLLIINYN